MSETRTNERGNTVESWSDGPYGNRYKYDTRLCASADGWRQYDTSQDASYFGTWVHVANRTILTYCEGDVSRVVCPTLESFAAELASMAEFYGDPPPAFITIDNDGTVTHHFDVRPTAEASA